MSDVPLDKIQLRGRRLLCRAVRGERLAEFPHIILSPKDREGATMLQAEILAIGDGDVDEDGDWRDVDPSLKLGMLVLHRPFARTPSWDESLDIFLLAEDDVLGHVE